MRNSANVDVSEHIVKYKAKLYLLSNSNLRVVNCFSKKQVDEVLRPKAYIPEVAQVS